MDGRPAERALTVLAVAWLAAVALIAVTGALDADAVASSPDAVAGGALWRLPASGLVVDSPVPAAQIALVAVVGALVLAREGAVTWWLAALVGHVGSALIAYAVIAVAIALGSASADAVSDAPDFGISCVLAALDGALLVSVARRFRSRTAGAADRVVVAGTAIALLVWLATLGWYGVEHLFAFGLGALVTYLRDRAPG